MKHFTLFLFILISFNLHANTQKSNPNDSLFKEYSSHKNDTIGADILYTIAKSYLNSYPDSSIFFGKQLLEHSTKIKYLRGKGDAYNVIGYAYLLQGNYAIAKKNLLIARKIRTAIKNYFGTSVTCTNLSLLSLNENKYTDALKYNLEGLKNASASGDTARKINCLLSLTILYSNLGNEKEALKVGLAALDLSKKFNDGNLISMANVNLSECFSRLKNYSEAINYSIDAIEIAKKMGNDIVACKASSNTANNYYYLGNYEKSLEYYKISLEMSEKLNDNELIAGSYCGLGVSYMRLNKIKLGKEYLDKSLALLKQSNNYKNLHSIYTDLSEYYQIIGNTKQELAHFKLAIAFRDSLVNEDNINKMLSLKMNADFEQKEALAKAEHENELKNQHILATEKQRKQNIIILSIIVGLIFVIVFAGYVFRSLRITRKQNLIIEEQRLHVEEQKKVVEEKQTEIIESITYAKRLQEAILPPLDFISKFVPTNFVLYKPKDIVAGDFYWAENIGDLFFIAAADSTGHGVPGAIVSVVCSNALNRSIKEFNLTETGKILDKTKELVVETFEKSASEVKDGMDISLLCIDSKNKKTFWSGANNSLWFIHDGILNEIKANKQPIGKSDKVDSFTTHEIEYKENTSFYLFTDGFADQFGGPKGKKIKYKPFAEILVANANKKPEEQATILNEKFEAWKGKLEQVDDVCVIGITI